MTGMDVSTAISTAKKCRPIIDPIGNSDILKDLISYRNNLILQSVKILNIICLNSLVDLFLLVLAIMITVISLFADYYSLFSLILPFSLLFCLRVYLSLPLILFFFFSSHLFPLIEQILYANNHCFVIHPLASTCQYFPDFSGQLPDFLHRLKKAYDASDSKILN